MSTFTIGGLTRTSASTTSASSSPMGVEEVRDDAETKPSQVSSAYWLFESASAPPSSAGGGKWMLFYPNKDIDAAWIKAKTLMRKGLLTGIPSMKVSTARENARASDSNSQVIIFYCGPPEDEIAVVRYGENLVNIMNYRSLNSNPYVYYKSDDQTMAGTRATGQGKNHLYKIRVPTGGSNFSLVHDVNQNQLLGTTRKGKRRFDDGDEEVEETRKRMTRLSPTHSPHPHPLPLPHPPPSPIIRDGSTSLLSSSIAASSSSSAVTTRIKFRLENIPMDGSASAASSTIVASFHVRQRLSELVGFLSSQLSTAALTPTGSWTLLKTFPTEELTDLSLTIEDAGLRNAVVIARLN